MDYQFIIDYIATNGGAVKEYDLLQHMVNEKPHFFAKLGENPSLYKKHFYLFHHLYLLRKSLIQINQTIIISTLEIRVVDSQSSKKELSDIDGLAEFYLNIENINLSENEVAEMLNRFWQNYYAVDKKAEAINILKLKNQPLSKQVIKKQYALLASINHPDKGGDPKCFIKIKQAYETLIDCVS